jgi:hypothetical protein
MVKGFSRFYTGGSLADNFNWYVHPPVTTEFGCDAVINAGPTEAYVISNGINFVNDANYVTTNRMGGGGYYGYDLNEYYYERFGPQFLAHGADCDLSGYPAKDFCFIGSV